jgi:cell division protease FtsH
MIDEEVARIVRHAQKYAQTVLKDNIELLQRMAKELLKYETLSADDIQKILEGKQLKKRTNGSVTQKRLRRNPNQRNKNKKNQKPKPKVADNPK